jgi:cell division protein FtsB
MARNGRPNGAAGRAPRGGRSTPSRTRRSRAALPARKPAATVPRRRAVLTARAAVLAVALASVALALALPFKVWVAQRGQINSLQSQINAQEKRVAQLRHDQQRWSDPAYIRAQARARLHYVMPGETAYIVLDKGRKHHAASTPSAGTTTVRTSGPWYSQLWQTVSAAGAAPVSP